MPAYYLRRNGKEWEIGEIRYTAAADRRTRRVISLHKTQAQAQQRYDQLTGATK
ncbi:Uncharacterised protein [Kingella potus]|uniref:Integrase n=1 Tax=Kingella potus TaxID=265175 RepID=A0A377R2E6_9NEIS|nr:hypothetical protein [Kingella potus]UOP00567.1 hypothetical protein LVJ84_12125 [Kingella potus]UOP01979.1 hypothetical protein LVJ84_14485 [Kingella potus]STR03070.1 Uncharacterised protein [Kingella potus]